MNRDLSILEFLFTEEGALSFLGANSLHLVDVHSDDEDMAASYFLAFSHYRLFEKTFSSALDAARYVCFQPLHLHFALTEILDHAKSQGILPGPYSDDNIEIADQDDLD